MSKTDSKKKLASFVENLRSQLQRENKLTEDKAKILELILARSDDEPRSLVDILQQRQSKGGGQDLSEEECEALVLEIMADKDE